MIQIFLLSLVAYAQGPIKTLQSGTLDYKLGNTLGLVAVAPTQLWSGIIQDYNVVCDSCSEVYWTNPIQTFNATSNLTIQAAASYLGTNEFNTSYVQDNVSVQFYSNIRQEFEQVYTFNLTSVECPILFVELITAFPVSICTNSTTSIISYYNTTSNTAFHESLGTDDVIVAGFYQNGVLQLIQQNATSTSLGYFYYWINSNGQSWQKIDEVSVDTVYSYFAPLNISMSQNVTSQVVQSMGTVAVGSDGTVQIFEILVESTSAILSNYGSTEKNNNKFTYQTQVIDLDLDEIIDDEGFDATDVIVVMQTGFPVIDQKALTSMVPLIIQTTTMGYYVQIQFYNGTYTESDVSELCVFTQYPDATILPYTQTYNNIVTSVQTDGTDIYIVSYADPSQYCSDTQNVQIIGYIQSTIPKVGTGSNYLTTNGYMFYNTPLDTSSFFQVSNDLMVRLMINNTDTTSGTVMISASNPTSNQSQTVNVTYSLYGGVQPDAKNWTPMWYVFIGLGVFFGTLGFLFYKSMQQQDDSLLYQ